MDGLILQLLRITAVGSLALLGLVSLGLAR